MSNHWTYMVDHLNGNLNQLHDIDEQKATDKASLYVEEVLLPKECAITYHLKQHVKADDSL